MYKYPYTLWSIWPWLSTLYRMFVLILAAVSIYSIVSATIVLKRMRALKSPRKEELRAPIQQYVAALRKRCANLRQILGATFFLFGFLLFIGLQNATITVGDGRGFPAFEILNNFVLQFVFAANVFVVFLVLHVIQWLTSSRLQAYAQALSD